MSSQSPLRTRSNFQIKDNLTVANLLTLLRIAAIPWVVALLYKPQSLQQHVWAGCLFGLALFTDLFDGMIARRTKTITILGQVMDPVADKLMVITGLVLILHHGYINALWVILLIGREVVVNSLRTLAGQYDILIPSILSGKIKVFAEGFGIGFLMGGPEFRWLGLPWFEIGHACIYAAALLATWSAANYFLFFYKALKRNKAAA